MKNALLIQVLREPAALAELSLADWDLLIRQARRSRLLARLAVLVQDQGITPPPGAAAHLCAAEHVADSQHRAVLWEARHIRQALADLDAPVLLLKGAAYAQAGLAASRGRLLTDIDILVPLARIEAVETELILHGWEGSEELSAHDQRYYREWMHEIPPMRHMRRSSVIDVHHNILPRTARITVDAQRLLDAAVPLPGASGLYRLGDADLVLHSASHLFLDGEFDKGLRDLVDLDALLRHFSSTTPGFWSALVERAQTLGLARVLFYALRYAQAVLGTPVPAETAQALAGAAPPRLLLAWMDAVFLRALRPDHPSCEDGFSGRARSFLYLRAHWMRMPLHLLLPHLVVKAWKRRFDDDENEAPEPNAAPR
jgi:hypothetical protein